MVRLHGVVSTQSVSSVRRTAVLSTSQIVTMTALTALLSWSTPAAAQEMPDLFPGHEVVTATGATAPAQAPASSTRASDDGPDITRGVVFLSISAALVATGLIFDGVLIDGFPETARNYEHDALDWVPVVSYFVAAGTGVGGLLQFF